MPKFKNSKSLVKFDGTKDFATGNVDLGQVRSSQAGLGEVGSGEVGSGEVGSGQVRFNNPTQRATEL